MDVWIVTEIEPGFVSAIRAIPDRAIIHGVYQDDQIALNKFNELCWEYVVEQESFGEEVAEFTRKDTAQISAEEQKAYYEQVWKERWDSYDSRFELHHHRVF